MRDRTKELGNSDSDSENDEHRVFISSAANGSKDETEKNDAFFQATSEIRNSLQLLEAKVKQLESSQVKILTTPLPEEGIEVKEDEELVMSSVLSRMRRTQHGVLSKRFIELINQCNCAQGQYRESNVKRIKRQLQITGRSVTDDQFDEMLESGQTDIFTCNTLQDTQATKQALNEIEARHDEILKLEKSIVELHEMFTFLAMEVEAQVRSFGISRPSAPPKSPVSHVFMTFKALLHIPVPASSALCTARAHNILLRAACPLYRTCPQYPPPRSLPSVPHVPTISSSAQPALCTARAHNILLRAACPLYRTCPQYPPPCSLPSGASPRAFLSARASRLLALSSLPVPLVSSRFPLCPCLSFSSRFPLCPCLSSPRAFLSARASSPRAFLSARASRLLALSSLPVPLVSSRFPLCPCLSSPRAFLSARASRLLALSSLPVPLVSSRFPLCPCLSSPRAFLSALLLVASLSSPRAFLSARASLSRVPRA
uniref:Syntaxin N-terminal domain-containing protein n=1 Tax=Leptobrachium leishanense TaxID=445787 RepID=A0A8C5QNE8_9ANUR